MRRRAGRVAGNADKLCLIVIRRRDRGFFLGIPPVVGDDAVTVRICPGQQSRVSGSRAGIGVVIVAVTEVGAVLQKQPKTAFAPLVAITLQVVATKLVDDDDDHQLGTRIVGGRKNQAGRSETEEQNNQRTERGLHRDVVYSLCRAEPRLQRPGPQKPRRCILRRFFDTVVNSHARSQLRSRQPAPGGREAAPARHGSFRGVEGFSPRRYPEAARHYRSRDHESAAQPGLGGDREAKKERPGRRRAGFRNKRFAGADPAARKSCRRARDQPAKYSGRHPQSASRERAHRKDARRQRRSAALGYAAAVQFHSQAALGAGRRAWRSRSRTGHQALRRPLCGVLGPGGAGWSARWPISCSICTPASTATPRCCRLTW